ncbi:MAG: zinc ribbon domain-containing protein [Deltaproteobacteria bacterium]|nr:zinc ribbon domain-containing protein [Deltaproteobacteria bacterium]
MPTYEYACSSCGKELELSQRIDEDPLTTCPECGLSTLERLVSRSSFALKGSGWYSDGYGGKADRKPDEAKPAVKPAETKTAEAAEAPKPEAVKPEASPETKKPPAAGSST